MTKGNEARVLDVFGPNFLIETNGPVGVEVYDISGKLIIQVKESQTKEGLNQLDVSLLPAGVYNFSVTYNGNTSTTKVLKK